MSSSERWLPVVGYEGLYEVSEMGFVRRLVFINGNSHRPYLQPRLLKRNKLNTGYLSVDLCKDNLVTKGPIHRLVLLAFVGPCPEGMVAAHANGKRDDPRLENLRWATWHDNEMDKRIHGTDPRGERNPAATFTDEQVLEIRRKRHAGARVGQLAREYGTTPTTMSEICLQRSWPDLAGSPPAPAPGGLGALNGKAKLTDEKVRQIRELRRSGLSYVAIARNFGVSKPTIMHVI